MFLDLCHETVYANRHKGGSRYEKSWHEFEANSIAFLLQRHFLGDADLPSASDVLQEFEGKTISERTMSLQFNLKRFNDTRNTINKVLTKQ